jgi:O-glycosyl hydrolase
LGAGHFVQLKSFLLIFLCLFLVLTAAESYGQGIVTVNISGKVTAQSGAGINGAIVSLVALGKYAVTDTGGNYALQIQTSAVGPQRSFQPMRGAALRGRELYFGVTAPLERVQIALYDCVGRLVESYTDGPLALGTYSMTPFTQGKSAQVYFLRVRIGGEVHVFRMPVLQVHGAEQAGLRKIAYGNLPPSLNKKSAIVDTLIATAPGYVDGRQTIGSYTGTYNITLQASPNPTYSATLSSSVQQPITGWGCFPGWVDWGAKIGSDKTLQDAIYRDLGMTVARVKIMPNYGNADGSLNTAAIDANLALQIQTMAGYGITQWFTTTWSPPTFMKTINNVNGSVNGQPNSLNPAYEDAFVKYYAAVLAYLRDVKKCGAPVYATIQNEPDFAAGWDGCLYTPDQWRRVTKKLRQALNDQGLTSVKIHGTDHNHYTLGKFFGPDLSAVTADTGLLHALDGIAFHSYNEGEQSGGSAAVEARGLILKFKNDLKKGDAIWETENCTVTPEELTISAIHHLRSMMRDIGYLEANCYVYWLGTQDINSYDGQGLIYNYTKTKLYYVFQKLWHSVVPGSFSVKTFVNANDPDLSSFGPNPMDMLAFVGNNKTVVLLTNMTTVGRNLTLKGLNGSQISLSRTSTTEDMAAVGTQAIVNTQSTILLPATSILILETDGGVMADATPPAIFDLQLPNNGGTVYAAPTLSWQASSDPQSLIHHYEVWFDGIHANDVYTGTNYALSKISGGLHSWYVVAVNGVDGKTVSTSTFTFTYKDTTPPEPFALVAPANNASVSGGSAVVAWNATRDLGTGMQDYEVWLDDKLVATVVRGDAQSGNMALGKNTASSGNETSGLGPENAVDGDMTTRWSSAFSDSQWIRVDLGQTVDLDSVVLFWQSAYGKEYAVQVSNDSTNWKEVYHQSNGAGGTDKTPNLNTAARYVRMNGIKRATGYGYSLLEFQIYASPQVRYATGSLSFGSHSWYIVAVDNSGNKRQSSGKFAFTAQ